jgi:hypothetical protein
MDKGKFRLAGWALLLLGVAGMEVGSPKPALFTLCGLLALAAATIQEERPPLPVEQESAT